MFFSFPPPLLAHHKTSISQLLSILQRCFILLLYRFRIKDLAHRLDPARSKGKNYSVSRIFNELQRILGQVPERSEFHS